MVVTVAEGKHRRLQLAAGYGSEEKARARVNWRHVNFGGGARTVDTEAKWSSLEQGFRGTFTEPLPVQVGALAPADRVDPGGHRAGLHVSQQRRPRDHHQAVRPRAGRLRSRRAQRAARCRSSTSTRTMPSRRPRSKDLDASRSADRARPGSRRRERATGTLSAFGVRLRPGYVGAAAGPAAGVLGLRAISRTRGQLAGRQLQVQRGRSARAGSISSSGTATRVGQPRPRPGRCRAPTARRSRFQALFRRRFDERSRVGPVSGQPAEPSGAAHRRPHHDGGVHRGPVRRARQVERRAVRGRRQRVARAVGGPGRATCAGRRARPALRHADRADARRLWHTAESHSGPGHQRQLRRNASGGYTSVSARRSRRGRRCHARASRRLAAMSRIAVLVGAVS